MAGIGGYDEVVKRSETVDVENTMVRILSLEGLILAKRAANREKDRLLLTELELNQRLRSGE